MFFKRNGKLITASTKSEAIHKIVAYSNSEKQRYLDACHDAIDLYICKQELGGDSFKTNLKDSKVLDDFLMKIRKDLSKEEFIEKDDTNYADIIMNLINNYDYDINKIIKKNKLFIED